MNRPEPRDQLPPTEAARITKSALSREVGHEPIQIPWLSLFDKLQYSVKGSEVTLMGQVVNPVTKDEAEESRQENRRRDHSQ